jgi:hypothetical protein
MVETLLRYGFPATAPFGWSNGMLEPYRLGVLEYWGIGKGDPSIPITPPLHYSISILHPFGFPGRIQSSRALPTSVLGMGDFAYDSPWEGDLSKIGPALA